MSDAFDETQLKKVTENKEQYREPRIRWHWQNLYKEDHPTARLSAIRDGRGWLRMGRAELGMQWVVFGRPSFGISLDVGDIEDQLSGHIQCLLFSFYWSVSGVRWLDRFTGKGTREISVSVHDTALWWTLWASPYEWRSTDPKWRNGYFHFDDFFLGKSKYTKIDSSPVPATISMPEGDYPATITFIEQTWKRPRLPIARTRKGATVKTGDGIPVPGKGTMSYNCEEDAFTSIGTSATTIDGAILAAIEAVNRRRLRYGGTDWHPGKGEL